MNKTEKNQLRYKYGIKDFPGQVKNINTKVLPAIRPFFVMEHLLIYTQLKNRIINKYMQNLHALRAKAVEKDAPVYKEWTAVWRRNVSEIIDEARKNGIGVALIDHPLLARNASSDEKRIACEDTRLNSPENYDFWAKQGNVLSESINELGRKKNVHVIGARGYFDKFSGKKRVELFIDEMHLSEEGDLILAKCIADDILKNENKK